MREDISRDDLRKLTGANLRKLRLAAKMPEEELAARMQLPAGFVDRLERGERGMTERTLKTLSDIFNVPEDYFFRDETAN